MILNKYILLIFLIPALAGFSTAQEKALETITENDLKRHIIFLASDSLQGRALNTKNNALETAANYLRENAKNIGLKPFENDYFQTFEIQASKPDCKSTSRKKSRIIYSVHSANQSPNEKTAQNTELISTQNVVGILEGSDTRLKDECIVFMAHYDHLGMGEFGSLSSADEPKIHNGADDNASGTAGVLELAEYFSENRPETDILFLAFSGEEMGLLGSQFYVDNPTVALENALAMINMDMIGRMNEGRLMIFGVATTDSWESILTSANTDSLALDLVPDGTGASDHTSFYYKNMPVLHYFTDTHADYHRPSDDVEWINAEGQAKLLQHVARVVQQLDALDQKDLPFVEAPGEQRQSMRMDGPTLGVLPDYGYDGEGFRITGVSGGGPAEQGGLEGGDIIIQIGEMEVADIYAYMGALNELQTGTTVPVTVMRDGEEMVFELEL